MTALEEAAVESITAAVADKPVGRGALACVKAGDVLAAAAVVATPDPTVSGLKAGAEGAAAGGRPWVNVYADADQLRHLLEQARK